MPGALPNRVTREGRSARQLMKKGDFPVLEADRKYQCQNLKTRHLKMIELHLMGASNVDIAREFGVTAQNVSDILNSGLAVQKIRALRAVSEGATIDVLERIREMLPMALEVMDDLLQDPKVSPSTRASISNSLLDRAGYAAPKQVEIKSVSAVLTADDIKRFKAKAKEVRTELVKAEVINED